MDQMEKFMKAIPAIYGDKGMFDFAAISKEHAGPGAHYPTKRELEPQEDIRKAVEFLKTKLTLRKG